MRRFWYLSTLVLFLILPFRAAATENAAALLLDCGSDPECTGKMLDGLYDRGLQVTVLLEGSFARENPELLERMLADGHELGCKGFSGSSMAHMSRRAIAGELMEFEGLLPPGKGLKFLLPPGGVSDGVRQVAQVRRIAVLARPEETGALRDGAFLFLSDASQNTVEQSLALLDTLLETNTRLYTVTQLAKRKQISLCPGCTYSGFGA